MGNLQESYLKKFLYGCKIFRLLQVMDSHLVVLVLV